MNNNAQTKSRARLSAGETLLILALIVLSFFCLRWLVLSLHSNVTDTQGTTATSTTRVPTTNASDARVDFTGSLEVFANNLASDALSDLVYIRKIYKIPENDLVAPKPDESKFGETNDPAVIQALIDGAAVLMEGQDTIWKPDIERFEGSTMRYYCDETILVVTWKEVYNGGVATFAEIKIADGSQLRRALSGNAFGSGIPLKATEMAASANAVVAINGDFYANRQIGLSVYQRQICRNNGSVLDVCFFNTAGDMLMKHAGELITNEEIEQYIKDNDVLFGISFGPILVENGELQTIYSYPVGEIDSFYSRAAIAQKGERHYLLMTIGQEGVYERRCQVNKAAELIWSKGVDSAYALDGGQTATMVMHGTTVNRVDWDSERTMSDIIYFATAIPEKEVRP
ncbi:MAG: phosphodiester glycosidase family protein [Oscillospiraceae bacterium]|nr:phosphodiester glycosidase family protein [Oscillospiraceae bacterium]